MTHGVSFTEPTLELMSDLVATHVVIGTCQYLDPRSIDRSIRAAVYAFQDAMTVLVIAHEYARVAPGRWNSADDVSKSEA